MAITDPTTSIIAAITNTGRAALADTPSGLIAFRLTGFQVGKSGYDGTSPNTTLALNPAATTLLSPLVDPGGAGDPTVITPFYSIELPSANTVSVVCRLRTTDSFAGYVLGEIGIFGTYLVNTATPSLVGKNFLFAHAHFPAKGKTDKDLLVYRVVIAL